MPEHVREVIAVHEGHGEEAWCPACKEHWPCRASQQPARPVYAIDAPQSMFRLTTIARALKVLHGPGLTMHQDEAQYVWYTPGDPCNCDECTDYLLRMIEGSHA